MHKLQPIIWAPTNDLFGVEILTARPLPFDDPAAMLELDLAALRLAREIALKTDLTAHSNVELATVLDGFKEIVQLAVPGMCIELTERLGLCRDHQTRKTIAARLEALMDNGVLVAMDDVSPTPFEIDLVEWFDPDLIKATMSSIDRVQPLCKGRALCAEIVETEEDAERARSAGADFLQGHWCDALVARELEEALEGIRAPAVL